MDEAMEQLSGEIARLRAQVGADELWLYDHVGLRVLAHLSRWREEGTSYAEIARRLGISDGSLHGWRHRAGDLAAREAVGSCVRVQVEPMNDRARRTARAVRAPASLS